MPCLGLYGDKTDVNGKEYSLKALKENYNEGKTSLYRSSIIVRQMLKLKERSRAVLANK